jgi:glycerol-3-phosphate acyltransferase PlsY
MTVPQIAEIALCIVFAVVGYLLGMIPLGRLLKGPAGLMLDVAKIIAAGLIGWSATQYLIQNHVPLGFRVDLWNTPLAVGIAAGVFALIGHFFPVWRLFRKRKAVGH